MEASQQKPGRRLACERCHRQKLRCLRTDALKCVRCNKMGVPCDDRSERPIGRPKVSSAESQETQPRPRATKSSSRQGSFAQDGRLETNSYDSADQSRGNKPPRQVARKSSHTTSPTRDLAASVEAVPAVNDELHSQPFDFDSLQAIFQDIETGEQRWNDWGPVQLDDLPDAWLTPRFDMPLGFDTAIFQQPSSNISDKPLYEGISPLDNSLGNNAFSASHASQTKSHQADYDPDTIEGCIARLSQLHLSLYCQSVASTDTTAAEYLSSESFPFENLLPTSRSISMSRTSSSSSLSGITAANRPTAGQVALGDDAKKIFGASQVFISVLTNLNSALAKDAQTATTRSPDNATVLLTLTCYLRLLSLYSTMVTSIGREHEQMRQQQRPGLPRRDSSKPYPKKARHNHQKSQSEARYSMPAGSRVRLALLVQMAYHLTDSLDHNLREYLCSETLEPALTDTPLFASGGTTGAGQTTAAAVDGGSSCVAKVALKAAVAAVGSSREDLRTELRVCECLLIDTV